LIAVAVKVTLVPAQMILSASEEETLTLAGRTGSTVVVILLLVAGLPIAQVALEVSTTETVCPFVNKVVLYVGLLEPTGAAPTYHWYEGVEPPLVGVAVKLTLVPAQMISSASDETIDTLTGRFAFTVVVFPALVAGLPVAQVALEVSTTVTVWPFVNAVVANVALFVPTGDPPIYH
jgi:hypothetical protein